MPIFWRKHTSISISLLLLIIVITNRKPLLVCLSVSYVFFIVVLCSFYLSIKLVLKVCIVINLCSKRIF
nr:MAG TPA: hypothetical protein [Bacteriophage sp.]